MKKILCNRWNDESSSSRFECTLQIKSFEIDIQLEIARYMSALNGVSDMLSEMFSGLERRLLASIPKKIAKIMTNGIMPFVFKKNLDLKSETYLKPIWTQYDKEDAAVYSKKLRKSKRKIEDGILARCLQLSELAVSPSSYHTSRQTKIRKNCSKTSSKEISLIRCLAWRAHYFEMFSENAIQTEERIIFLERQLVGCLMLQTRCSKRNLLDYFVMRDIQLTHSKAFESDTNIDGDLILPESMYLEWIKLNRPDNVRWRTAAVEHHRRSQYKTLDCEHVARLTCWTLRQLLNLLVSEEVRSNVKDQTCAFGPSDWASFDRIEPSDTITNSLRKRAFIALCVGLINADYLCTHREKIFFQHRTINQKGEHNGEILVSELLDCMKNTERLIHVGNNYVKNISKPQHMRGSNEWKGKEFLDLRSNVKALFQHQC
jgi:hypothetical protein